MKKTILFLAALLSLSGYSQQKLISLSAEDVLSNKLTNSLKIIEEKSIDIPIYKDTLIETGEYKELVREMNRYKRDYDQWLKVKKVNEKFNADITTIINNLESYSKSKENYETTKPLIDEAQNLILKNKIYYHDRYGRTNNELIILSPNGKKPQKTRSFLDETNYETPIERCLWYCKAINKLEEPTKAWEVDRYLDYERKVLSVNQFEKKRLPSSNTIVKKCLLLNETTIVQDSELVGDFEVSDSKYAILYDSEGHTNNEIIEVSLIKPDFDKPKALGSEIFTNVTTGKKYFSDNPELLSNIESQKKLMSEKQESRKELSKYGTVYYDKERESYMLKIKTGAIKLSSYNLQDIPEFITIYNSLYTKYGSIINQMPAHIAILKKYYTLHRMQGRNMSQTNINAWIKAVKSAAPIRTSMRGIIMNEHYGDFGFYPNFKNEERHEDFDLYYNASLSILGL
ncbi:hypothetical protein ACM55F_04910 [Flavobacterium sp. XS2P12]|uniref:hypothetical protein n=1 Tax=Flavobacterium melibiosi TaxID=3398734 RepID=UPI003A8782FD